MTGSWRPTSRGELDSTLMKSFVEGVSWPIDRGSLVALSDLGLTDDQIASYFSVEPHEVRAMFERHLIRRRS
jgi:hypothetical protein